MIKYLTTKQAVKFFNCPFDKGQNLAVKGTNLKCPKCQRVFKVKNHIIEFVTPDNLDKRTKDELIGNTYQLDQETITKFASKDKWTSYHKYCSDKKLDRVINRLDNLPVEGLVSLGSGTGFEIQKILTRKKIKLIFSSDLSLTATMIVPFSLKKSNIDLVLFTSDFNYPPFKPNNDIPIIIYEAMHHTKDIHKTFDKLLDMGYQDILFVEPTTNFIVKFLAKFGLAEREEYSGFKPSFLFIPKLRQISKKHNYNLEIHTVWEFPEDYFRKIFGDNVLAEKLFTKFMDVVSGVGDLFKIGSMSVGYLRKRD